MKSSILILTSIIMILVIGLTYNLFKADRKIDRSFYINKQLDELRIINKDINFIIKDVGRKDYDYIDALISKIDKILMDIKMEVSESSINDKDILYNIKKFRVKFNKKITNIEKFKSVNSLSNNTYNNIIKLKDIVNISSMKYSDIIIFRNAISHMLTLYRTNRVYSTDKLKEIVGKKYNNQTMDSLIINLDIYKDSYLTLRGIQQSISYIDKDIENSINHLISSYVAYNKAIIYDIRRIILAFIITIFGFFLLLYMLMDRVAKVNKLLKYKTEDLENSLLTISQNVIHTKTDTAGIITEASDAFCEVSGYSVDELVGKSHRVVGSLDTDPSVFSNLWKTISKDKEWRGEIKNTSKDGVDCWVSIIITPIYNSNGIKIGYGSVRHNITDRIAVENLNSTLEYRVKGEVDKNREKDKHMLQQSRLAQMGEMISMIAHQWRQPLAAISNTSNSMVVKATLKKLDDETVVKLSNKILDYSSHLSSTIDDFRDFFKSNKEIKETNYSELIDSVMNIVEDSIINKNIKIVKNLHSKDIFYTHPNEIKQVILNLIKNAEDVLLENHIVNPTIKISTNGHILRIEDNGGGIPKDIIDKIFDPYFSTKIKKDGTGLGLYMSRTIVEHNCNGELKVYNGANGAIFEIILEDNNNDE